jgi:hypothetical protein
VEALEAVDQAVVTTEAADHHVEALVLMDIQASAEAVDQAAVDTVAADQAAVDTVEHAVDTVAAVVATVVSELASDVDSTVVPAVAAAVATVAAVVATAAAVVATAAAVVAAETTVAAVVAAEATEAMVATVAAAAATVAAVAAAAMVEDVDVAPATTTPQQLETTVITETRTPALGHKSNKGSKKTSWHKTQTSARESMTFALLQKPAEFAKITAALEETCAKKSTENALKLQSPSTMFAAENFVTKQSTLDKEDVQANTDVEAVVPADAELEDADQSL